MGFQMIHKLLKLDQQNKSYGLLKRLKTAPMYKHADLDHMLEKFHQMLFLVDKDFNVFGWV